MLRGTSDLHNKTGHKPANIIQRRTAFLYILYIRDPHCGSEKDESQKQNCRTRTKAATETLQSRYTEIPTLCVYFSFVSRTLRTTHNDRRSLAIGQRGGNGEVRLSDAPHFGKHICYGGPTRKKQSKQLDLQNDKRSGWNAISTCACRSSMALGVGRRTNVSFCSESRFWRKSDAILVITQEHTGQE